MTRLVPPLVALIVATLAIGTLTPLTRGATPSGGSVSDTSTTASWTGQTYVLGATTLPDECPPLTDPANVLCDHFFLNIDLASNFWDLNTGQVTIRITWASADNDFDLYVYAPDGSLAGSSGAGGTVLEEVALPAPAPGTYEVRVVPFLVSNSGYSGEASLLFTPGGPSPNPVHPTGGIVFAPSTVVDPQRTEGEPIVHVDRSGNIWESGPWGTSTQQSFVHKSVDAGDSFHVVSPIGLRPDAVPGGGDTDVATDDQGFAYFADLEALVNIGVAVSNDGGNSWRKNPATVASVADDRQWLAVDNGPTPSASDNTVFLAFRGVGVGVQVYSSPGSTGPGDPIGGIVYQNAVAGTRAAPDATCGQPRFDPVFRNLYLVCGRGDNVEIIRGHVSAGQRTGITFTRLAAPTSPGGGVVGDIFPGVTVDSAGNVYAVWIDETDHNVYLSASTDQGNSWGTPIHVNGAPSNTNVWVWAAGGSPGIVDVVWYGTSTRGDPGAFPSWFNSRPAAATISWFAYFAQVHVDFASPAGSTIYQVRASEHPNHLGQICQEGIACTTGGDRSMADFFAVTVDKAGAAVIVYDDTTNQHHGAALFVAKQIAGPGAFGRAIRGKAPANPMVDPSGDAQFPHFSPGTGPGPNQPAMDFTRVAVSQPDPDHVRVTMTVGNAASLTPPTGAQAIVWLTRWQSAAVGDGGESSFRIFYAGARSLAGGSPTFFSGTGTSASSAGVPGNGCITNTPQNCKIVLYPVEIAESGSFNRATGTITINVPLADIGRPAVGDVLFSVTALSLGEITGDPLLQDVDATRAFDFVVGGTESAPRKITGSGAIATDSSGGEGRFNLVAHTDNRGKVDYRDSASGLSFASAFISSVTVAGQKATIKGTGFVDGTFTTFVVVVQDLGEPGTGSDTYSISLGTGYARSGVLLRGNIQIH